MKLVLFCWNWFCFRTSEYVTTSWLVLPCICGQQQCFAHLCLIEVLLQALNVYTVFPFGRGPHISLFESTCCKQCTKISSQEQVSGVMSVKCSALVTVLACSRPEVLSCFMFKRPYFEILAQRPAILYEVFLSPTSKCWDSTSKLGHDRFISYPFELIFLGIIQTFITI